MPGLFRLLEFNDVAVFVGKRQFMAKPLPLADDGLPFSFALLVELVHILHGSPVGDVPHLAFTNGAVEHGAAGQQPDVSLVQRGTGCPVHVEFNAGQMRPASLVISTNAVRLPTHRSTAA